MPECFPARSGKRRAGRLDVVDADEFPLLTLVIGNPRTRHRLQRARKSRPHPARTFGDPAFLPPIARQKDDDAIHLAQLIGAQNQRFGGENGHPLSPSFYPVCPFILRTIFARPRNAAKPQTSVKVVMKTVDARAGSIFRAFSPSGMRVPAMPATKRFTIIAARSSRPSAG